MSCSEQMLSLMSGDFMERMEVMAASSSRVD